MVGIAATLMLIPTVSYITRRINRLNQSTLEFADGNLSVRTDIKGHDEIAKRGDTFNLMDNKILPPGNTVHVSAGTIPPNGLEFSQKCLGTDESK